MFLVVVDAHSKSLDVYPVTSSTSASTILIKNCLKSSFSTNGIPEMIVSDNTVHMLSETIINKQGTVRLLYHSHTVNLTSRDVDSRKFRCTLDLMHPDLKKKVEAKQVRKDIMTNLLESTL